MEEEGARRRKYKGRGGAGVRGFLGGLNEDDEDEEEDEREKSKSAGAAGYAGGRAGPRDRGRNPATPRSAGPKGFELDMDGATLLGRRHRHNKAGGGGVGMRSPLAGNAMGMEGLHIADEDLPPGSPMQVV